MGLAWKSKRGDEEAVNSRGKSEIWWTSSLAMMGVGILFGALVVYSVLWGCSAGRDGDQAFIIYHKRIEGKEPELAVHRPTAIPIAVCIVLFSIGVVMA